MLSLRQQLYITTLKLQFFATQPNHRNNSGVIVMVSHYANIVEISGVTPQEGETIVIKADKQGDLEVAGGIQDWRS